jgi:hypothetical protein
MTGRWIGALATLPALFFVHATLAAPMRDRAPAAAPTSGESVLGRWRDYALSSITPQFSWAIPVSNAAPGVLDRYGERIDMPSLFSMGNNGATRVSISIASGLVGDTPTAMPSAVSSNLGVPQSGVERTIVTPSLTQQFENGTTAKLSAVLAYQRFASMGLGVSSMQSEITPPTWAANGNTSYGAGARVDFGGPLAERFHWGVAYQSRVGMDSFPNYRGVYSDPGDFDIPASASAAIGYALTPEFGMDIGVQRVMYSAITPFTSPSLPTRFLALLGDGASPIFRWQDLTVYSVGWTLRDADTGNVELRYTTRQQPLPSSALLAHALAPQTANDMVSLAWSRPFGDTSRIGFAASYASSPYLLMMPVYRAHGDANAGQLEFETMWSVRF